MPSSNIKKYFCAISFQISPGTTQNTPGGYGRAPCRATFPTIFLSGTSLALFLQVLY